MTTSLKEIFKGSRFSSSHNLSVLWDRILGSQITQNTIPIRFQHGALTVLAASSAWANQLRLLRGEIKKQLNQHLGDEKVNDIKFIVDLKFSKEKKYKKTPRAKRLEEPETADMETLTQKLEKILMKKEKKQKASAETNALICQREDADNKKHKTMLLLRRAPWVSFKEAAIEVEDLDREEFQKIKRRMRVCFQDEIWRAAKEILKNDFKDVSKLKNLLYDYVMIKTNKRPDELNLAVLRNSVSVKLWKIIGEKVMA